MEPSRKGPLILVFRKAPPFGAGPGADAGKPGGISQHSERFSLFEGHQAPRDSFRVTLSHLPPLAAANLLPTMILRIWDNQLLIQIFPLLEANVKNIQAGEGPMAGAGPTAAFSLALRSLLGLLSMLAREELETFLHLLGACFTQPDSAAFQTKAFMPCFPAD